MNDMADMCLRRGHGREVTRDEALIILQHNEDDGLVLQPANAQNPEFVCSCCGCCCGMLSLQKSLPHPIDFWASNFYAKVTENTCTRCGKCVTRCQVNAVSLSNSDGTVSIKLSRCIGCGLCVSTCTSHALHLEKKHSETIPPKNEEALNDEIMDNKKGIFGNFLMLTKIALKMRQ
jgi:Pyruvate/2-oxoacid:ferredoxin oxidoreductase delta subunit